MGTRIKGQEVLVVFQGPDGLEEGLGDVQSAEFEFQQEVLSEGYLGETSNRRDDIFNGITGSVEVHIENSDYMRFVQRVKDRAQRRTPGAQFNVITSFAFPDGERVRLLMEDVFFGSLPVSVGGRGDYVSVTVSFECQEGRYIF